MKREKVQHVNQKENLKFGAKKRSRKIQVSGFVKRLTFNKKISKRSLLVSDKN